MFKSLTGTSPWAKTQKVAAAAVAKTNAAVAKRDVALPLVVAVVAVVDVVVCGGAVDPGSASQSGIKNLMGQYSFSQTVSMYSTRTSRGQTCRRSFPEIKIQCIMLVAYCFLTGSGLSG